MSLIRRGLSFRFRFLNVSTVLVASFISMMILIACIVLLLPTSKGKLAAHLIILACNAASFPQACQSSLSFSPLALQAKTSIHIVEVAIQLAEQRLQQCHAHSQTLLHMPAQNPDLAAAAHNCEYLLRRAGHMLRKCQAMPGFTEIKSMEAWMSAALTWENDCYSALGHVNGTYHLSQAAGNVSNVAHHASKASHDVNHPSHHVSHATHVWNTATHDFSHAAHLVNHLMQHVNITITLTSNALSLLDAYDTYGPNPSAWNPPSRSSLPGSQHFRLADKGVWHTDGVCSLNPAVTVSKDGLGNYTSIQAAVDGAPENASERYVIYIKEGMYNESVRIPYTKTYLAFVGDGIRKTVITGNRNVQMPGVTTYDTATVAVDGDGFLACDLAFENTAHPELHQAVALRVDSDLSAFYNCSFLGHQDTLYAHSLRQFYRNCRIEGTMDFIFGNAASVFQSCQILVRPGRISSSVVTAHGRTDPAQTTGLVFEDCIVNGTEAFMMSFQSKPKKYKVYLGRPWKMYARTIYMNCLMERLISPEGWRPWSGAFALDTLFYGEYNSSGLGAYAMGRVKWSEQIPPSVAILFTVSNFIQGDEWLSSMFVPYNNMFKT